MTRDELLKLSRRLLDPYPRWDGDLSPKRAREFLRAFLELDAEARVLRTLLRVAEEKLGETVVELGRWKTEYKNVCKFANDYEEQRDLLRAEITSAPILYWHESSNPDEVGPYSVSRSPGYRDTHRARLVRIEPISEDKT